MNSYLKNPSSVLPPPQRLQPKCPGFGELERMTQLYLAAESHGLPLSGKQKSTIGNKLIYSFKKKKGGTLLIPIHSPMTSWSCNSSYKLWVPSGCPGFPVQIGSGKEPPRKDSETDNEVPKAQRQSVIQVPGDTYTTLAVRSSPNSVTWELYSSLGHKRYFSPPKESHLLPGFISQWNAFKTHQTQGLGREKSTSRCCYVSRKL